MGKYETSMFELSFGSKGARILRSCSHTTPRKNGWFLICVAPPNWPPSLPIRCSASHRKLHSMMSFQVNKDENGNWNIPPYQRFRIAGQRKFLGEIQAFSPVDDLTVGIRGILGTERGPPHKTFEHDSTNRPPITKIGISLTIEDFGCDIIRCADCRISHGPAGFSPGVDLPTVRDCQVYRIVEVSRVAILILRS
jgi:hypothetical protein